MSLAAADREAVRTMVREAIREFLPPMAATPAAHVEEVTLTTDAELSAFVTRLLDRADDVRAGRLSFRLRTAGPYATPTASRHVRVDKGAVTEAMVNRAAKEGATLLLARRAVATPLALDRARDLGVRIERER